MSSDRNGFDQLLVVRDVDEAELATVAFLARYSGRRCTRAKDTGWTAPSSEDSCSGRNTSATSGPRWRCCSG